MEKSTLPPLCALLLHASEPSHHEYRHILSSIDKYYTRLETGMQDETVRDQFVLNPGRALSRLEKCFDMLQKEKKLNAHIAEAIFNSIVLYLLNSTDHDLSPQQAVQLVGSVLPVIIKHPGAYIRLVADLLLKYGGIFEHLIADESHSTALKKLLLSKDTRLNGNILMALTQRLMNMCQDCQSHGLGDLCETWRKVTALMAAFEKMTGTQSHGDVQPMSKRDLPSLETMKALRQDDKKSYKACHEEKKVLTIDPSAQEDLELLGCPPVSSTGTLQHALDFLRHEKTPEIMHKALESFPCRVCLERITGSITTLAESDHSFPPKVDVGPSIDIFGKRIGPWKVLMSDAAVKTARKLARKDDFIPIELKLRDLASGAWKGKDLSYRVGSTKQKQSMQVPVLQARVTPVVSILWQVDVGFDHEDPDSKNLQQIVKVWQITTAEEEVNSVIDHIVELQSCITIETIELCNQRPFQADGTYLPKKFGHVEKGVIPFRPTSTGKIDQVLVDLSNRCYNMTEEFLKSIADTTGCEEFPFELSPEEMDIIKHFSTSSFILGRSGTGKTTCLLFKILAKYKAGQGVADDKPIRQLLLTRSPHLAAKLQSYARSLLKSQARPAEQSTSGKGSDQGQNLDSFFVLKQEDFPFVCTYDEFLGHLEGTFRRANRQDFLKKKHEELYSLDIPRIIDFHVFKTEYWNCLSGIAPPGCSAELLFAEIMGVLKGSRISAHTLLPLPQGEYLAKNSKVSPAFASESEREKVYQAFERYERLKKQRNQIDELDRVSALLKVLKENQSLVVQIRQCFEEIYVDEIQDLRCLDIVLLMGCLSDARGITLAGDSAQCISKDSVFRFPEIKAVFFEYFEVISKALNQPSIAKPTQFMLAKNYRSHQGILCLASWVMELLWSGFPDTIDKLSPEIGQTGGLRPIIFAGFDASILSAKMIGLVKLNAQVADFGAEQVILVRDEEAKGRLQTQIGDMALVLTTLEGKGMEFDDVLVYDFFGGSGLGSSYRSLHLLAQTPRAKFDSQKHAALCSELKHLYVAITRARKQLWFMEPIESSIDPVLQALSEGNKTDLVEVLRKKDPDVAEKINVLRAGSTVDSERWIKRAAQFLQQKSFAEALFCFKKADYPRGVAQAQAWLHEQEGRSCRAADDLDGFRTCFEKAISLFLEMQLFAEAADCYQELGGFVQAAELWKSQGQLRKAAALYETGGYFRNASDCLCANGEYEQAIEVLRRGSEFDELICCIERWRQKLGATTLRRYSRLCNILLKQGRISSELRFLTISLLGSEDDKIAFFKEFEMWDDLLSFYTFHRKWIDVYELHVSLGNLHAAMSTLLSRKLFNSCRVGGKQTIEPVFNFAMVETLLARLDVIEKRPGLEQDLLSAAVKFPIEPLARHWLDLFSLFHSFENEVALIQVTQNLLNSPLGDLTCLLAVAYESELKFPKPMVCRYIRKSLLINAGKLIQRMDAWTGASWDDASYRALALLCGLWTPPTQPTEVTLLCWSPLQAENSAEPGEPAQATLLNRAKCWIRDRFAATLANFDDKSMTALKEDHPRRCQGFSITGSCFREHSGKCPMLHERSTSHACKRKLVCILDPVEVMTQMSPLYLQRVMSDSFQSTFLKRRRRWLHFLLDELIFVSSYEQCPCPTSIAWIQKLFQSRAHGSLRVIASSLESLQYYRLNFEFHQISSFTGALEQLQIAYLLGPQVAAHYSRALIGKLSFVSRHSQRRETPFSPLRLTLAGARAFSNIHRAIAERNAQAFSFAVHEFSECMENVPTGGLSHFHALMSVVELVSTYILSSTSAGKAIVIPWSWALQHLSQIYHGPLTSVRAPWEPDQTPLLGAIKRTVSSLCRLVERIEPELSSHRLTFAGMGRNNLHTTIVKRRIFDCVSCVYLNLASYPQEVRGLNSMWVRMQKALTLVAPPGFTLSTGFSTLRESVARQYRAYADKDRLRVICLDDSNRCPAYLSGFLAGGEVPLSLSYVLSHSHRNEEAVAPITVGINGQDVEELGSEEVDTVVSIQRRWRQILKMREHHRKLMATPTGQLHKQLSVLCQERFATSTGSASISPEERARIRKLVLIDGMDIMGDLGTISTSIRQLKEEWKKRIDDPLVAAEDIEELDNLHGQIGSVEAKLKDVAETWSLKGLTACIASVASETLNQRVRQAQRQIVAARREIEVIRGHIQSVGVHEIS